MYQHSMFNIFISVSLGQCCGLKTCTSKWVWCSKEGALCCITVGNLGHKLHSPLYFQLKATTLEETDGLNLLIDGVMAGVTANILGVLRWPMQHQACWHQMGLSLLSKGGESLLRKQQGSLAELYTRCEGGERQCQACPWQDVG